MAIFKNFKKRIFGLVVLAAIITAPVMLLGKFNDEVGAKVNAAASTNTATEVAGTEHSRDPAAPATEPVITIVDDISEPETETEIAKNDPSSKTVAPEEKEIFCKH